MADPRVVEIMLNPDGSLWTHRLGVGMERIGTIEAMRALTIITTVAALLDTVVTQDRPILDGVARLDASHRIVVIEDTRELQVSAPNVVFLRTSDTTDMTRLLCATMRLRPDRIVVGEVRDASALTLFKAWNTGHPGGVGTVHAHDADGGLIRVGQLIQEAGVPPNPDLIAEAVNVIVSTRRTETGRRVEEVAAVRGWTAGVAFTSRSWLECYHIVYRYSVHKASIEGG